MDLTQTIYFLASTLLITLPQLIVLFAGIGLSFANWSKNPKVGKMALIGLGTMLLMTLIGIGFSIVQVQMPFWYRDSYQTIAYINVGVRFVLNIVWALGLGTLIYAVWTNREN